MLAAANMEDAARRWIPADASPASHRLLSPQNDSATPEAGLQHSSRCPCLTTGARPEGRPWPEQGGATRLTGSSRALGPLADSACCTDLSTACCRAEKQAPVWCRMTASTTSAPLRQVDTGSVGWVRLAGTHLGICPSALRQPRGLRGKTTAGCDLGFRVWGALQEMLGLQG